jgi:hypothetical protein
VVTDELSWVPQGVDQHRANIARVYDYLLGGTHNFSVDQDVARSITAVEPNARAIARTNRWFLRRAVSYMVREAGIRQFLDIGSGIPTQGNVHEVAQAIAPDTRVVYVDIDPVAIAHSRMILADNSNATIVDADLSAPETILTHPETRRLIDFDKPLGLLLSMVVHFLSDQQQPLTVLDTLSAALAPGSHLLLGHATNESKPAVAAAAERVYNRSVSGHVHVRTRAEITRMFAGFDLLDPGVVYIPEWRPDAPEDVPSRPEEMWGLVGVGRKP